MKSARLLKPVTSKRAGMPATTARRAGSKCLAQRHAFEPGVWILWFGKEYARIDAIDLPTTITFGV